MSVHKDAATLEQMLDPATFAGIVISDDAAVYANFTHAQKCWAHLLRKAIKLTLVAPDNAEYRRLADGLLEVYREACRVQRDGRFSDAGRAQKVAELDDEILELCGPVWFQDLPPLEGSDDDYRRLCHEVMRLMLAQELFTFVTATPVKTPTGEIVPVSGTNNESERTLRNPAGARDTGRTNKTLAGARRRTIHVSFSRHPSSSASQTTTDIRQTAPPRAEIGQLPAPANAWSRCEFSMVTRIEWPTDPIASNPARSNAAPHRWPC